MMAPVSSLRCGRAVFSCALLGALTCCVVGIGPGEPVRAEDAAVTLPAKPLDEPWDGLSALKELAKSEQVALVAADVQTMAALTPADALLLVGPRMQMPVPEVAAFLREGGRVALLDDLGSGARMLATYQVQRERPPADVPALRGNRDWLLAYPAIEHPLTEGVPVLLTNRAVALGHPDLRPVFTFGAEGPALVLSGAVGPGRLVIIGDSSLFINQLLGLPSHRRFAQNLLGYLARPGGRIYLVGPSTVLQGQYGGGSGDRRHDWNDALRRLARPELGVQGLTWLALLVAALACGLALVLVPRRSPYARHALVDRPARPTTGGLAQRRRDFRWEALELRHELLAALRRPLGVRGDEPADELAARGRAQGLSDDEAVELSWLLGELGRIGASQASPFRRRVLGNDLLTMIRLGERLLAKIGHEPR
jgi:hypothetical protein